MKKIKEIMPGFLICLAIALLSKILALIFPTFGAATFAIFIGIVAGNTIFNKKRYEEGSKFSESELLAYSIVLMGGTLNLGDIASVGINGIIFIVIQMILIISIAYIVGRRLGYKKKFALLMGSGNAVCGSSAIAATAPVIDADSKEKGISITMVNVTGTILMFLLPIITGALYNHSTIETSGMIGGVLQSVGQVIASAKFVNEDVVEMATIFKIMRIILLVLIVLIYSKINVIEDEGLFVSKKQVNHKNIKVRVPWYIIGFFILSIVNSMGFIPLGVSNLFKTISGQFEIIALGAIGMRVKIKDLIDEGPKAMLYSGIIGLCQIIIAIVLIRILL